MHPLDADNLTQSSYAQYLLVLGQKNRAALTNMEPKQRFELLNKLKRFGAEHQMVWPDWAERALAQQPGYEIVKALARIFESR